jgi:uncharacterized membrane protein YebE (DUF533 family)
MWGLVVRMLMVFAFWGGAMAAALAAGANARTAELWAAAGAGVTLGVLAMLGARRRQEDIVPAAAERPVPEPTRERASV